MGLIKWDPPKFAAELTRYIGYHRGDRYTITLGILKSDWGLTGETCAEITLEMEAGMVVRVTHIDNIDTCKAYAENHAQSIWKEGK